VKLFKIQLSRMQPVHTEHPPFTDIRTITTPDFFLAAEDKESVTLKLTALMDMIGTRWYWEKIDIDEVGVHYGADERIANEDV
jgi:hypothetical protein